MANEIGKKVGRNEIEWKREKIIWKEMRERTKEIKRERGKEKYDRENKVI